MRPSSPTTPTSRTAAAAAASELEQFREQWKQEVRERSKQPPDSPFTTPPSSPSLRPATALDEHARAYPVARRAAGQPQQGNTPSFLTALDLYLMAIEMERQGQLGQSLVYYRRAFKLDPEVDKLYHRQSNTTASQSKNGDGSKADPAVSSKRDPLVVAATADSREVAHLAGMPIEGMQLYVATQQQLTTTEPLDVLAIAFCRQDTAYKPAVDYKGVAIAKLPGEMLVQVLGHVVLHSVSSVANCAVVCKRFFVATRSPSLWRHACEHVFQTPGMSMAESRRVQAECAAALYEGQWLRMFMDRPRLHYDGVYISVCQYIRQGESESAWTRPVHLVTYYRYLRFFPDGTMIKYLSTDEPAAVVRLLTPDFSHRTQVFRGRFEYVDQQTVVVNMRDKARPRDHFCMTLDIKTTRRARHNKLAWREYWSRKDGRDESAVYDLALMRPFVFSVVRSFRE